MSLLSMIERSSNRSLVEMKAGKMNISGKMVVPDLRKGLLYLCQSEDTLMHLCWKERNSTVAEDDFIVFPKDVEYKHIKECTTGRVFVLKLINRNLFFWMQDIKSEKDEEHFIKMIGLINNPPTPKSLERFSLKNLLGQSLASDPGSSSDNLKTRDMAELLADGSNQKRELLQFLTMALKEESSGQSSTLGLSSSSPASNQKASSTPTASSQPSHSGLSKAPMKSSGSKKIVKQKNLGKAIAETLAQVMDNVEARAAEKKSVNPPSLPLSKHRRSSGNNSLLNLQSVINADHILPVLSVCKDADRLIEHLPVSKEDGSRDDVATSLRSPQFKSALTLFSRAAHSSQLGPVLQQFGFPSSVVMQAAVGDLEDLAKAMEELYHPTGDTSKDEAQGKDGSSQHDVDMG